MLYRALFNGFSCNGLNELIYRFRLNILVLFLCMLAIRVELMPKTVLGTCMLITFITFGFALLFSFCLKILVFTCHAYWLCDTSSYEKTTWHETYLIHREQFTWVFLLWLSVSPSTSMRMINFLFLKEFWFD